MLGIDVKGWAHGCPAAVVKETGWSPAMVSGGSVMSRSVTWAATTVSVHDSPLAKSTSASTVNVVGPPLTETVCAADDEQVRVNDDVEACTGSLKMTDIGTSTATLV